MSSDARSERRAASLLFACLLGIFVLGAQGGIVNPDAEVEFQTARSLWLRGSAGLSDRHADASSAEIGIVRFVPGPGRRGFDCMRGVDGKFYSWFGVGHALVLVPFVAAGRALARVFPEVEANAVERAIEDARTTGASEAYARAFSEDFFAHLLASYHSSIFAAGLGLLFFLVLGHFGFALRTRILASLLACLTTQLWPGAREGMSDIVAGFFLVASLERVLAWRAHDRGAATLVWAGMLGGFAIACRPAQLVCVAAIGVYVLWHVRRRPRHVFAFAIAALPFVVALLAFNYVRFADMLEFGYSAGTSEGYWSFPILLGLAFLLASPGKGALIFSPLLLVAPRGMVAASRERGSEVLLVAAMLVLPWLLSARMTGWHSSQAWASRYMTVGSALCIAVGVAALLRLAGRAAPAGRFSRRLIPWIAILGFAVNLGGIVTPYRGYYDLGRHAWAERWKAVDPQEDLFQRAVLTPRFSPAIGHWLYAWESAAGRLPSTGEDAERSWQAVYGVVPRAPGGGVLPQQLQYVEDRAFRHIWWIGLSRRFGSWLPAIMAAVIAAFVVLAGVRLEAVTRGSARSV